MQYFFNPNVIFEIGVGSDLSKSTALTISTKDSKIILFEANPNSYKKLKKQLGKDKPNVTLINVAIGDNNKKIKLWDLEDCSFVDGIKSPIVQNNNNDIKKACPNGKLLNVKCRKISEYDNGNIEYLMIDCEGSEWFVLKHLISRPEAIIIELFDGDKQNPYYINPYKKEIEEWFKINDYSCVNSDVSNSLYIKNYYIPLLRKGSINFQMPRLS